MLAPAIIGQHTLLGPGTGERERWLRVSDSRSTLLSLPTSSLLAL